MKGYPKAMCFVSNLHKRTEGFTISREEKRLLFAREINLFHALCQTDYGSSGRAHTYGRKRLHCSFELPSRSVYYDQLWQRKFLLLQTAITPLYNLSHRGQIVCPLYGFHVKLSILFLGGLSVAKDHTCSDRSRSL